MNRRYLTELYEDRVQTIKALMPDCCIGVDVITGFPGETEEEFLKTYQFLNKLDISYLHVFTYSERANTQALQMEGVVPLQERQERSTMLRTLSEKKKRHFYTQCVGQTSDVLFEADVEHGMMEGFTENYVRVKAKYDPILINEIKAVELSALDSDGLMLVKEVEEVLSH
jgi:threonylcarbamoyladenosine tRNA methylthiotransferase MtaB